jgi:hypothetical protein
MPRPPYFGLLALLALLFVGLGLPRYVVLCDHGDGGHVELQHAPGACVTEVVTGAGNPQPADPAAPIASAHCDHVEFGIDEAPPTPHVHALPAPRLHGPSLFAPAQPRAPTKHRALAAHEPPGDPPAIEPSTRLRL